MDIFMEYIVKHKPSSKDRALQALIIFGAVILFFAAFLFSPYLFGLGLLVMAAVVFFAYVLVSRFNVEYEYILTENYLDIDRIASKRTRKRVVSLDLKEISIFAAVDDPMHKHEFENSSSIVQTLDCTGAHNTDIYFIDYSGNKGMTRVLFEPPTKFLEAAQRYNPRKIFKKQ